MYLEGQNSVTFAFQIIGAEICMVVVDSLSDAQGTNESL